MSFIDPETGAVVPAPGSWPVDPQEDVPLSDDRIWIDGCFDFSHHGAFLLVMPAHILKIQIQIQIS